MKKIIEKYRDLHEICKNSEWIELRTNTTKPPQNYAKDGFIENFCLKKEQSKIKVLTKSKTK